MNLLKSAAFGLFSGLAVFGLATASNTFEQDQRQLAGIGFGGLVAVTELMASAKRDRELQEGKSHYRFAFVEDKLWLMQFDSSNRPVEVSHSSIALLMEHFKCGSEEDLEGNGLEADGDLLPAEALSHFMRRLRSAESIKSVSRGASSASSQTLTLAARFDSLVESLENNEEEEEQEESKTYIHTFVRLVGVDFYKTCGISTSMEDDDGFFATNLLSTEIVENIVAQSNFISFDGLVGTSFASRWFTPDYAINEWLDRMESKSTSAA